MGRQVQEREKQEERRQYIEMYKKYLHFYDMQRFSDSVDSDLTIQRCGGDEFSLMTELVLHRKFNTKLFYDPDMVGTKRSGSFDSGGNEIEQMKTSPSV